MIFERPCIVDGCGCDGGRLPDSLYVYQNVRTTGQRGLNVARHMEVLDAAAREVLGAGVGYSPKRVENQISGLLSENNYPSDGLSYVTLRQYLSGEFAIIARGLFPYKQRRLRMFFPRAGIVDYSLPLSEQPTAMSEAAVQMAMAAMRAEDATLKCVIRRNPDGEIVSADGAPLFIFENGAVVAPPPAVESVEFESAVRAVSRAGFPFSTDRIDTDRLLNAEELFFADYRGLTAVSACGEHVFIHMAAERIGNFF